MRNFNGLTIYLTPKNTQTQGKTYYIKLAYLIPVILIFVPILLSALMIVSDTVDDLIVEYKFGLESVKRQVLLIKLNSISEQIDEYKENIQSLVETDKYCRMSYGMKVIDPAILRSGIGGTALPSYKAISNNSHKDIVTSLRLREQVEFYSRQQRLIQESLDRVESKIDRDQARLLETPSIRPATGHITSRFGSRFHPILGYTIYHHGLDIAGKSWSPILASADGVVVRAQITPGYGKLIEVHHTASGYKTRYAHLNDMTVSVGDVVKRGEQIGSMGSTGRSTGTHLHYEVHKDGVLQDPEKHILGNFNKKS